MEVFFAVRGEVAFGVDGVDQLAEFKLEALGCGGSLAGIQFWSVWNFVVDVSGAFVEVLDALFDFDDQADCGFVQVLDISEFTAILARAVWFVYVVIAADIVLGSCEVWKLGEVRICTYKSAPWRLPCQAHTYWRAAA